MDKGIIDRIGYLEGLSEEYKNEAKKLREQVNEEMSIGEKVIESNFYAKKIEKVKREFDTKKIFDKINNIDKFVSAVKVISGQVKQYLSLEDLDECIAETKVSTEIKIMKINKEKEEENNLEIENKIKKDNKKRALILKKEE